MEFTVGFRHFYSRRGRLLPEHFCDSANGKVASIFVFGSVDAAVYRIQLINRILKKKKKKVSSAAFT
jgi:hypothetical protein